MAVSSLDKRAYEDQRAQNAPAPEGACAKLIIDAAARQLSADSVGNLMAPDKGHNAQRQPGEDEQNQAVVHGFLAVVSACDRIDIRADV